MERKHLGFGILLHSNFSPVTLGNSVAGDILQSIYLEIAQWRGRHRNLVMFIELAVG